METTRKKLGSNLGPAPAFGAFAPAPPIQLHPPTLASAAPDLTEARGDVHAPEIAAVPAALEGMTATLHAEGEASAASNGAQESSRTPVMPKKVATVPKVSRVAGKASAPTLVEARPDPVSGPRRLHGTFADPYQRKTDGAQTRQTTLTVDTELDDRFETFFRKNRRTYRTRSSLWTAAMTQFLEHQDP